MNSTSIKIKKFLSNRNTVTIICAVLGIIVLYVGYTMKVQNAVEPVSVPYAKITIQPSTKITDDMIGYMQVARAALDEMGKNVILDKKKIIDSYSNINTMIPAGSMFYENAVVKEEVLPNSPQKQLKDGEVLHYMTVNMSTSYVNSIVPGDLIDLYVRDTDINGKARTGRFITNVRVIAVRTSDGLNVFDNTDEVRVPAYIMFGVDSEQYNYLIAAQELGINVYPVPKYVTDEELEDDDYKLITSEDIMLYIDEESERFEQIVDNKNDNNQNNDNQEEDNNEENNNLNNENNNQVNNNGE